MEGYCSAAPADYEHFAKSPEFSAEDLRERVEEQHRCVIEDLRSGEFDAEIAAATEEAARASGIEVQLLNPRSWLMGGKVSLDLAILRRADRQPEDGAQVEASIEGAQDKPHTGTSDGQGRATIEFPLPPLGKGDLTLVIQACGGSGKDEIRFAMRSKPKAPSGRCRFMTVVINGERAEIPDGLNVADLIEHLGHAARSRRPRTKPGYPSAQPVERNTSTAQRYV